MDTKFTKEFKSALRAGVPLIAVTTADPAGIVKQILGIVKEESTQNFGSPLISWDIASGLKSYNKSGADAISEVLPGSITPEKVTDPKVFTSLLSSKKLPPRTITIMYNGHRLIGSKSVPEMIIGQAIWNLRDEFKQRRQTLVIPCPSIDLPPELTNDVLVLEDPLPGDEELTQLITSLHGKKVPMPEPKLLTKSVEAVKGLSLFGAEQAYAMSLKSTGVDLEELWARKRTQIEQIPGLSIWRGKETFADVEGVQSIKSFLTSIFNGNASPTVVVFMDEIEKSMAGSASDSSGVSQEMHGQLLSWMADNEVPALLEVGHPGCTKSFLSKATGGEFGCPTVMFNLSDLKAGIVGQSTQQLRAALRAISAIGKPLIMATSNNIDSLSPELKSRFTLGTYFFDLPTAEERKAVWKLYIKKLDIGKFCGPIPQDADWTPREIKACCELSWRLKCPLQNVRQRIVPIVTSSPERIEQLRRQASKRFLSASTDGVYQYNNQLYPISEAGVRSITLDEVQMKKVN